MFSFVSYKTHKVPTYFKVITGSAKYSVVLEGKFPTATTINLLSKTYPISASNISLLHVAVFINDDKDLFKQITRKRKNSGKDVKDLFES